MFFNLRAFLVTVLVILVTVLVTHYYKNYSPHFDRRLHLILKQGEIVGRRYESALTRREYYGFSGIPYAKAPVGELRFKEPKALEGYGVSQAHDAKHNICVQRNPSTYVIYGNEDCLFLNIYTPELPLKIHSPKAVMVFLHGGAFKLGSGAPSMYSPDYLINYDVIIVTVNYRLDILGFLNLGLTESPGNVGMKDQVMALKWVKKNIRLFGGDPNNVTIFGESAGSTSVNLHMISPMSKGLFQKCIMESGNSINTNLDINEADEVVQELKIVLGYEGKENIDLLNHLKGLTVDALFNASERVVENLYKKHPGKTYPVFFIPSVEKIKENSFLPENPSILVAQADPVPVIAGLNDKEFVMLFPTIEKYLNYEGILSLMNDNLTELVKENLSGLNLTESSADIATKVKEFYFHNKTVNENSYYDIIDLYSDLRYVKNLYKSIQSSLKSDKPVYIYRFSFKGNFNFGRIMNNGSRLKHWKGVNDLKNYTTHMDELGYLFYPKLQPVVKLESKSKADGEVIDVMCKLWTNFAKTGNPNGNNINFNWSPSNGDDDHYLVIDEIIREESGKIFENKFKFWDQFERKI